MYKFEGTKVAVLGGDKRELEIARNFLELGAAVATYGVVEHPDYVELMTSSLLEAVRDADIVIAPVPGIAAGDVLYAPAAPEELVMTEEAMAAIKPQGCFFSGTATPTIREKGKSRDIRFFDLKDDDYLQVMHAIPTAEGAISVTVQETDHTIHGSTALVVGYGRIATLLAKNLRGMGAKVTVAARRPEVKVRAYADGHDVCGTSKEELKQAAAQAVLLYNTVPSMMLDSDVLDSVRKDALVMDLASPPGGIDHDAGKAQGLHVVWARGQAGKAPIHSGYAQFLSIRNLLDQL
ncbi:hypothetical protein DUZ99_15960 [Xylanibacillus composti]|uniref:Dipicolinate synthase n=1 Tax=Xylanibacillus composti TaxID=1572762 RepID=A0A8J4H726_9BACL|nr:dipicolinate synthase subunit DpsA [Xylanibacillus composti]MDT9726477.1 hypothetical protein [Xylanibacillus composti]GIQ69953.1 dipicolinate synthase [Xylanibacillus composti]